MSIKFVGIVNVTPDSFSDGGKYFSVDQASKQINKLLSEGASFIDIGADSTRPGSECVGSPEECRRIEPILKHCKNLAFSIDTHNSETVSRLVKYRPQFINDVSAGNDPKMFEIVASNKLGIILMYSRCSEPHRFDRMHSGDIINIISDFLIKRVNLALQVGIRKENIILDPGMGGFVSSDPKDSYKLLERFSELEQLGYPLMLGVSRKKFIAAKTEPELDSNSAKLALNVYRQLSSQTLYVRCHNVEIHRNIFTNPAF